MEFQLKIVADLETAADYVRGVLWSILFHRLFGCVNAAQSSFYGVAYPLANDPVLEELVDAKAQTLADAFSQEASRSTADPNDNMVLKGVMVVKFYDREVEQPNSIVPNSRPQSQSSSVSASANVTKNANCWEKWVLKINILNNKNPMLDVNGASKLDLHKQDFENNLFAILEYVDTNKSHIPPIASVDIAPFPFKVLFALNTHEAHTLNRAFRNFEVSDTESDEFIDYSMESLPDTFERNKNAYTGQEMLKTGYKFIKKLLE